MADLNAMAIALTEATLDPARWNKAMDVAARATGSFGAILVPVKGRLPVFPLSYDMRQTMKTYVDDGWIHHDERYKAAGALVRRGVCTDFDFTSPDAMKRMAYYEDFLARTKLRWFAGVKVGHGDDVWCLAIQRTFAQGPFETEEIERLASLSHQLAGIPKLAATFGYHRVDAALHGFETSGSAAAVVDRFGSVVRMNASAERLLDPDFSLVRRRLVSFDRDATSAINRALDSLLRKGDSAAVPSPVVLPRRQGRPILAYFSRLPEIAFDVFSPGRVCIIFVDLEARPSATADDLIAVFGLAPAEAKLALQIQVDDSLERAAANLGINYETARTVLKSIFRKTDTNKQAQLAVLLSRIRRPPT